MTFRITGATFLSLCLITSGAFAQQQHKSQHSAGSEETDSISEKESPKKSTPSLSPEELKAQKELEALQSRPEDYRVLVMGVQIFLGRFGYGTGPYNGKLDEKTQAALRAYQQYVGLSETGQIDYRTLEHLTHDNQLLDEPLPFLPPATFHLDQWDKAIQVQGTWAAEGGLTKDAVQTSRISCFREEKECIESTAVLITGTVPLLEVLTSVYTITEWDEEELVSAPFEGEPCTITILRINRKLKSITRFTAYQQKEGVCENVQTRDVLYHLVNGPQVYGTLKQEKAIETKRILRVKE